MRLVCGRLAGQQVDAGRPAARLLLLGLLAMLWGLQVPTGVSADADTNRLYEDLMMTYNRIVRPVQNNSDKVVVRLSLKLSQLIDVVSREEIYLALGELD